MFAILVAGRLVQTNCQQVDAQRFVFMIENAREVNHLVVFMVGSVPFPDGFGGSIYFGWPPYTSFSFLGYLTNSKPSCVFRLKNSNTKSGIDVNMDQHAEGNVVAQVGISIESLQAIEQRVQSQAMVVAQASAEANITTADMLDFGSKMLTNFVNYALSFTVDNTIASQSPQAVVPTLVVEKWFDTFKRKLQIDPYFWTKN